MSLAEYRDFIASKHGQAVKKIGISGRDISAHAKAHQRAALDFSLDKGRSALSVNAQARCRSKIIHRLGPSAFYPRPKVRSAVMELTPLEVPLLTGEKELTDFETVVKAAFSCRRKTIRNALSIGGLGSQEQVVRLLEDAGIDPGLRPGSLSVQDFLRLAKRFGVAHRR